MSLQQNFSCPVDVFSALLDNEISCLLTDIAIFVNSVIVIDNENNKIKRFSFNKTLIDFIELDDPCGVTKLHLSSHVAVTRPRNSLISFISIGDGDKMTLSSSRRTKRNYQSISCLDEMRLVAGCCELGQGAIDILSYEGGVLQSVEFDKIEKRIFRTPASLACFQGRYVLISDSGRRELICIDTKGDLQFVHDPEGSPSGVSVTKDGDVYLCIYDKSVVQKLDMSHGASCGDCLSDVETRFPLATCVTEDKILLLTEEMPSDRIIIVNLEANGKSNKHSTSIQLSNIHLTFLNNQESAK